VISYQKQIVGREVSAGVFDVLGTTIADAGGGESALEPIQLAVRAVIERAVLEMVTRLYHMPPEHCAGVFAANGGDPLDTASADQAPTVPAGDGAAPASDTAAPAGQDQTPAQPQESQNDARQNPYRGYSSTDNGPSLRGGV
jgi:curli production assembly/transport component CsgG/holdfast attachment protein HfaB